MFYRENGQFKTTYQADQQIFPIRQDRLAIGLILVLAFLVAPALALLAAVLAQARLQRGLELFVDRLAHFVELGAVALLQLRELAFDGGAHLGQAARQIGRVHGVHRGVVVVGIQAEAVIDGQPAGRVEHLPPIADELAPRGPQGQLALQVRRRRVLGEEVLAEVDRLNGAYTHTLDNHGVEIVHERATVSGPHEVTLASGKTITAGKILIAVGARPAVPNCPGSEHGITSNEVFHLDALPKRVLIAGAGYIANEFAGIFNEFGSKVTLINRSDVILRGYDEQIRDRLLQISMTKGIDFRFHAEFRGIEKQADGSLKVSMTNHEPLEVDLVLFATGRVPNTEGLGLAEAGVELDAKGAIVVGAEGEGLSRLVRERCDRLVALPMRGRVGSLNASAALAAVLYAYALRDR